MLGALCMSYYEILNMKNQIMNANDNSGGEGGEGSSGGEGDSEGSGEGSSGGEGDSEGSGGNGEGSVMDNSQQSIENEMYKKIMMEEFDKQLKDIRNGIDKLTNKQSEKHLTEFGKGIQTVAVSDEITDIMERAYWDKIKEEISSTPSNFSTVLALFNEIGDMLKELTPKREDAKAEIARVLDIDYIQYMVDQNNFGKEEIERIFLFYSKQG